MRRAVEKFALLCVAAVCGCAEPTPPRPAPQQVEVKVVDAGPTVVELGAAKAEWRDTDVVKFEIPYRFTSGSPHKVYQCRVTFPNDGAAGVKPMEAWELKQEGVIKTGIPSGGKVVKAYSIAFYEADAPDKEFKLVSNKLTGEVPAPTPPVESASPDGAAAAPSK